MRFGRRLSVLAVALLLVLALGSGVVVAATPREVAAEIQKAIQSKRWTDVMSLLDQYIQFDLTEIDLVTTSNLSNLLVANSQQVWQYFDDDKGRSDSGTWRYMKIAYTVACYGSRAGYQWNGGAFERRFSVCKGYAAELELDMPDSPWVHYEIGRLYEAIYTIRDVSSSFLSPYFYGQTRSQAYSEATRYFRKAIELDGTLAEAWYHLVLLVIEEDPKEALQIVEEASSYFPKDARFPLAGALDSWKLKDYDGVLRWAEKAAELPAQTYGWEVAHAQLFLGMAYHAKGDTVRARASFSQASRSYLKLGYLPTEEAYWDYWRIDLKPYSDYGVK